MGHAPPVGQSKAPALLKSANPLVGCFPADRPAPTQLGQLVSLSQVLFNESPALNFVTTRFPRHICLESVTYAVRKKCNLCADNMPTPCAPTDRGARRRARSDAPYHILRLPPERTTSILRINRFRHKTGTIGVVRSTHPIPTARRDIFFGG